MRSCIRFLATLGLAVTLLAACVNNEELARAALKAAEEGISAVRPEAAMYVPGQLRSVEAALGVAQADLSEGNYKTAIAGARALGARTKDLAAAVAAKKAELAMSWDTLAAGMPQVIALLKNRIDILSESKMLPVGMTADNLTAAKAGLADLAQSWTAASDAYELGNVMGAVTKATAMKGKAAELLAALGMPVPLALKAGVSTY